jgi:hypothetical protein
VQLPLLQELFAKIGNADQETVRSAVVQARAATEAVGAAAPAAIRADVLSVNEVTAAQLAALEAEPTRQPDLSPALRARVMSQEYVDASTRVDTYLDTRCGLSGE